MTQFFIFSRLVKWAPGIPGDSVVKSKISLGGGSEPLRQLNPIHKKEPLSFFFQNDYLTPTRSKSVLDIHQKKLEKGRDWKYKKENAPILQRWKTYQKWKRVLINPLSASFTKWSNILNQFVGKLPTNCLSVFDHFVGLALKGLSNIIFEWWKMSWV